MNVPFLKVYWSVGNDNNDTVPVVGLERLFLVLHTGYGEAVATDAVLLRQLFGYSFCTLLGEAQIDFAAACPVVGKSCYGSFRFGELLHVISYGKHVHFLIRINVGLCQSKSYVALDAFHYLLAISTVAAL